MSRLIIRLISLAALCVLSVAQAAAQTSAARDAFKGSRELREKTASTASSIDDYVSQLDKVDRSLQEISRSHGALNKRYKAFSQNLRSLEKAQARTAAQIEEMKALGTDYFTSWERANVEISDTELREASGARRSRVMTEYEALANRISRVALSLPPLMGRFRDLNLFLGTDATAESVQTASEMIRSCRLEARGLKGEIVDIHGMLKQLIKEAPE